MKNKIILIVGIISLIIFNSCSEDYDRVERINYNGEDLLLLKWYYNSGNLKSESTFLELNNIDTLVSHGYSKFYYENSKIKTRYHLNRGDKIGSASEYYRSGNIKKYVYYNLLGDPIYIAKYDSLGNEMEEIGREHRSPLVGIKMITNDSSIVEIYSPAPPHLGKRKLYLIHPKGNVIDSIMELKGLYERFKIRRDTGSYEVILKYFSNNQLIEVDTNTFDFNFLR